MQIAEANSIFRSLRNLSEIFDIYETEQKQQAPSIKHTETIEAKQTETYCAAVLSALK